MIKGIAGHSYHQPLTIPIIENTPRECNLANLLAAAIRAYPKSPAVLVRRHGVYVWGKDWRQAKCQAECLDYLCEWAVKMRSMGLDASLTPVGKRTSPHSWLLTEDNMNADDQTADEKQGASNVKSEHLFAELGVKYWHLDADAYESDPVLARIRAEREYDHNEICTLSADNVPEDEKRGQEILLAPMGTEAGELARYILDGSAFLDVQVDGSGKWTRIHMKKGDLVAVPIGLSSILRLDLRNYTKVMILEKSAASPEGASVKRQRKC